MNCLWVEQPCPPTASPSPLHLPAPCFKLPVAFCSCSFISSTMDTKACGGERGEPYFYHTDGRITAAHVASLLLLHVYRISVLYSCVFTCYICPPASDSCREKRFVHVRIVVAIKKTKCQSPAFVRKLSNCFHFHKLL